MNIRKCSNPMNINGIEEWMTQFFTDPFTSLLDEHTFRVDLFETSEDFIIEAELGETKKKEDIQITTCIEKIKISVQSNVSNENEEEKNNEEIARTITLPYSIEDKEIIAAFNHGILEIKIAKNSSCEQKRNTIQIVG
ncbi:Hsp20/alpha crystallin family protein [Metabacillus bambusae]|uniref:Hsp20/alpha crystallin family protein n=1 Tax=Metabacillus bambusae TaxID=2795218 RepID=A0ABS3MVX2_9BACI|nr:Hsp20 family protein [Metabacillus bambusae]MBO1510150.1 Hsp20/alpha crystallin family protein [Metabacillus bambusae]